MDKAIGARGGQTQGNCPANTARRARYYGASLLEVNTEVITRFCGGHAPIVSDPNISVQPRN
ncbi:MAG: hypothetical protein VB853_14565 [Pirellulales bacterium]